MAVIKKKAWLNTFEAVRKGQKRFDLRLADFKIKKGDTLLLREWNPKKKRYTGRELKKRVSYVFKFKLNDFGQKTAILKKGLFVVQL